MKTKPNVAMSTLRKMMIGTVSLRPSNRTGFAREITLNRTCLAGATFSCFWLRSSHHASAPETRSAMVAACFGVCAVPLTERTLHDLVRPLERPASPDPGEHNVAVRDLDVTHSQLSEVALLRGIDHRVLGRELEDFGGPIGFLLPIGDTARADADHRQKRENERNQEAPQDEVPEAPNDAKVKVKIHRAG
jgi:hypothetical protein